LEHSNAPDDHEASPAPSVFNQDFDLKKSTNNQEAGRS
jgi:hypothetical protein